MRKFGFIVLWVVGIGMLVLLLPNHIVSKSELLHSYQKKNLQRAVGFAKISKIYGLDHGGRAPLELNDLLTEGYLEGMEFRNLGYYEPDSKQHMEWLYFPLDDVEKGDGETLYIVSPIAHQGRRVVVFTDLPGRVVRDEECEEMLERQRIR